MPSNIFSSFKDLFKSLLIPSHINRLRKQPDLAPRPSNDSSEFAKARLNVKLPWKRRSTAPPVQDHDSYHIQRDDIHDGPCATSRLEIGASTSDVSAYHKLHEQQCHRFSSLISDAETTSLNTYQSSHCELGSDCSSEYRGLRVQRSFYRLHYGPQIDNIENGPRHDSANLLLAYGGVPEEVQSLRMQKLDHEVAKTLSLGIDKQQRRSIAPSNNSHDDGTASSLSLRCKTSRGICRPTASCVSSPPETPTTPRSFMSLALRSPTSSRRVAPAPRPGGHHETGNISSPYDEGRGCKASSVFKQCTPKISLVDTSSGQLEAPKRGMLRPHQEQTKAVVRLRHRQQQMVAQKDERQSRIQHGPSRKLPNITECARIVRRAGDRDRDDIRSPNEPAFTPQTTSFCDWPLGLRQSSEQSLSTHDDTFSMHRGDNLELPSNPSSHPHSILAQTERAERLLMHIKERVDDQLRLENALWETDALLMRYEAEIARDWEAKFVELCQNVRELQRRTMQNRANAVMAFSISAIFCLLGAIAFSALVMPSSPAGSVALDSIKVVTGRYDKNWVDYKTRNNEFANTVMQIDADLSSLFHWNTKQLVVFAVAEYSTPTHPKNQIVLWDSIIKRKSDAVIHKRGLRNKYSLIDVNKKWSNVNANVSLHWNIVPYVGFMTYGRSQASDAYAFPLPSGVQT
ncbi:hypothetical protein BGZ68_005224 [Mortierella alpina]|nr:hypothetical protein BGZ68_005224 [Mortierella alpina]